MRSSIWQARQLEWLPERRWRFPKNATPRQYRSMPHLYPFIVNDPGEGTQAKRRNEPSSSTI